MHYRIALQNRSGSNASVRQLLGSFLSSGGPVGTDAGIRDSSTGGGCRRILCRHERDYPLKVEHYLTVVVQALGIEHEDLFKKHMLMSDTDAILADASPCAVASGGTQRGARDVVQRIFAS